MTNALDKLDDRDEMASEFNRMRLWEGVLKNATAEPRRKSERSHVETESFTIPWEEFEGMTKRELWDNYVKEIERRLVLRAKRFIKRSGRELRFFKPKLPASTPNRRVVVFDKHGVFVAMIAQRKVLEYNFGRTRQEVAEITFVVEIEKI